MATTITEKEVRDLVKGKLARYYGVSPVEATKDQIYKAVVMSVRDILLQKRQVFSKKMKTKRAKRVYYLCMEFLLGRSLKNSLYNLSAIETFSKVLEGYGVSFDELYELEPELTKWIYFLLKKGPPNPRRRHGPNKPPAAPTSYCSPAHARQSPGGGQTTYSLHSGGVSDTDSAGSSPFSRRCLFISRPSMPAGRDFFGAFFVWNAESDRL